MPEKCCFWKVIDFLRNSQNASPSREVFVWKNGLTALSAQSVISINDATWNRCLLGIKWHTINYMFFIRVAMGLSCNWNLHQKVFSLSIHWIENIRSKMCSIAFQRYRFAIVSNKTGHLEKLPACLPASLPVHWSRRLWAHKPIVDTYCCWFGMVLIIKLLY